MNDDRPPTTDQRPPTTDASADDPVLAPQSSVVIGPSCVTCSDEALPARVLNIDQEAGLARVMVADTTTEVDITLIDELAPGDLVLVHGGVALERLETTHNDRPGRL